MNNCHECGSDIIYPNDAFDVISKIAQNNDCETNQIKKRSNRFN